MELRLMIWYFCTGLIYIPEIKYRRILNKTFGPGGWALVPRGESLQFQVKWNYWYLNQLWVTLSRFIFTLVKATITLSIFPLIFINLNTSYVIQPKCWGICIQFWSDFIWCLVDQSWNMVVQESYCMPWEVPSEYNCVWISSASKQ